MYIHTTYIHTSIHTYIHTYIHIHTHTYTHIDGLTFVLLSLLILLEIPAMGTDFRELDDLTVGTKGVEPTYIHKRPHEVGIKGM